VLEGGSGERSAAWTPRRRALAGLASILTEAPWTVDDGDLARLREAGLTDGDIVQATAIAAVFNHLTRVADATGIAVDYVSALPRIRVDPAREPLPRPPPDTWPRPQRRLALSPAPVREAIAAWRAYAFTPSAALPERDRAVLARAAAFHTCDAAGVAAFADAEPRSAREAALAAFAEKLTVTPWRMAEADLAPLRALGLADRDVLHAIALVGLANMLSRLTLALGPISPG
jgi:alkylhydroperoxidase family enzyme